MSSLKHRTEQLRLALDHVCVRYVQRFRFAPSTEYRTFNATGLSLDRIAGADHLAVKG